jgi:hypothetical protein
MDELVAQGAPRPAAAEKRLVAVEPFLADFAVPGLNPQQHRLPVPTASSNTHTVEYSEGARREARGERGTGAVGQLQRGAIPMDWSSIYADRIHQLWARIWFDSRRQHQPG